MTEYDTTGAQAGHPNDSRLLQALPAAAFAVDVDGRLLFWNDAAERLWGRRPEAGERDAGERLCWRDGRPRATDGGPLLAAARDGLASEPADVSVTRADGTLVQCVLHASPLRDAGGAVTGALALLFESAPRGDLDLDRERLAAIVSSSNDAIIGKTLDGIVTSWNEGATRMYGYRAEEMLGRSVTLLMPEEGRDEEERLLARLRRGERVGHFDTVRVTKDGRRIDVSLSISPIRDGAGRIVGASKVARDITERKRAEELQRLLFDELNHRVKNTLATIQAIATQSLRRARDPASFVGSFSGRVQALARAHDLLVEGEFRGAGIAGLVREQVLLGASDARVQAAGPEVCLDPRVTVQLALVLHELATNARKHGALARPDGRLAIEWRVVVEGQRRLLLTWTESGVPGVRAPGADTGGRGFGTTLIARSLETAGGLAKLTYAADGLACLLELPLVADADVDAPVAASPARAASTPAGQQPTSAIARRRILVVEDEPLVAMDVESTLSGADGIVLGPVATVSRALALIAGETIDAAVLDANLGGSSVGPVADALAACGVPFVFATGYGRDALPAPHRDAPMLVKPIPPSHLVAAVAALLGPTD